MDQKCVIAIVAIFVNVVNGQGQLPESLKIGAIFEEGEDAQEAAFRQAVEMINYDRTVLVRTRLNEHIETIHPGDSFRASKKVCQMIQPGLAALIGPNSESSAKHVQCMADQFHIPHIETRWDYSFQRPEYSINVHPHPAALGKAYADLIRTLDWKSLVILFENEDSLVKLQEVIKLAKSFDDIKISLRQLDLQTADYRPLLKEIKKSGETRIVLDCKFEKISEILRQAEQIGLISDYHNYLITSLDLERLELAPYKYVNVNITGFRMIDTSTTLMAQYQKKWIGGGRGRSHPLYSTNALTYDAVRVFAKAMDDLGTIKGIRMEPLNCRQNGRWNGGADFLTYLKSVQYHGLTGEIRFDMNGYRNDFKLDLMEKTRDNMVKTGIWMPETGVNYTRTGEESKAMVVEQLQNKTLRVTTTTTTPFVMMKPLDVTKEALERMSFEEKYEGYVIDMIKHLSEEVKFKYKWQMVADGNYGGLNENTGEWNGMIRELMDQKADMAVIDLSMTSQRQEAVDFTMPYMNTGVGIMYKKKAPVKPNLFSFLSPLSIDVWIYMTTAYLATSILMFLLARISPYEWDNPHPCKADPEELETQFTVGNALWFGIGSFLCQGSDILPKAISTRMVAGMWWFFTLIMISSYTANLAAFLTAAKMDTPINSAEDLAKQTKIKYGTYKYGSTNSFFRGSSIPTYQKLNAFMESAKPSVYTGGNSEGIERVRKEDGMYAFFMEAAAIEYHIERKCDLTQIGGLLDSKGYGIALPPNSPYTKAISDGILSLQEKGILQILKVKWWKEMHGGGKCVSDAGGDSAQLGLPNLGGVFIVLLGGMIVSCFIAVFEFMWETRKLIVDENESIWAECWKELKFAIDLRAGDTKPVPKEDEEDEGGSASGSQHHSESGDSKSEDHYGVINEDTSKATTTEKSGKKAKKAKSDSSYAAFNDNLSGTGKNEK